jgi:farnesyl-diphosphate farnesyltransferase
MKSPASVEEAEKKQKEEQEAKWDLIYMITAVHRYATRRYC